jgi:hypothetical protein
MTSLPKEQDLSVSHRRNLEALADALIPGGHGLPSAGEAEVAHKGLDKLLAARPDLRALLSEVSSVLAGPAAQEVERLKTHEPALFREFAVAVAGAYLLNAQVRRALGFPGIAPTQNPSHQGESEYYLEDGILDVVIERGPIFRDV